MGYDAEVLESTQEATQTASALVPQNEITEMIAKRDAALAQITDAARQLETSYQMAQGAAALKSAACFGEGFYHRDRSDEKSYKSLFNTDFAPDKAVTTFRQHMDACIWQHLFKRTGVWDMMDATAKKEWEHSLMGEVPEVTLDNVLATLETVGAQSGMILRRGLALAFSKLDRRFKSHDGFKVGSRIIINNLFDVNGSLSYGRVRDTLIDVERAFSTLDGEPPNPRGLEDAIRASRHGWKAQQSEVDCDYFKVRGFKNGNAHLWFSRPDLVEKVNKLLAEYYGEVIPDGMQATTTPEDLRSKTNLPAKDLQYYFTPESAVEHFLSDIYLKPDYIVLEPSAGTGHIVRHLLDKGCQVHAVEIHPDRVAALKGIDDPRLRVQQANFLQCKAHPVYDLVVMNPPFYGTHWMQHVLHAWDFVKPGGYLMAILPATAEFGESSKHETFRKWVADIQNNYRGGAQFRDMPIESFAEAGTNINTVRLHLRKG